MTTDKALTIIMLELTPGEIFALGGAVMEITLKAKRENDQKLMAYAESLYTKIHNSFDKCAPQRSDEMELPSPEDKRGPIKTRS